MPMSDGSLVGRTFNLLRVQGSGECAHVRVSGLSASPQRRRADRMERLEGREKKKQEGKKTARGGDTAQG